MGASSSKSSSTAKPSFAAIADKFTTLDQVVSALRSNGLESSNLIVAVDYTKSNEWTGKHSFNGRSLHACGSQANPYEVAISIIAKTLRAFDDDGFIPAIGFGDATTQDTAVFNFFPNDAPAHGLEQLVSRYRELTPHVKLSGPTSFAPAIYQAMKLVIQSGCQYHILVIVADGQVTRSSDLPKSELSRQEKATVDAIVAASQVPLSIVLVGVGDGPWDVMQEFDDKLPSRKWDNFQFVNFTDIATRYSHNPGMMEAIFAVRALMEIPDQFKLIQRFGLLGNQVRMDLNIRCLPPPGPAPGMPMQGQPPPPPAFGVPQYPSYSGASGFPSAPGPPAGYHQGYPPIGSGQRSVPSVISPQAAAAASAASHVDPLFICPITQEVMSDPVIAADGYTYDRSSITRWLQSHDTSPMSNAPLTHKELTANHALRSSILEFIEKNERQGAGKAL